MKIIKNNLWGIILVAVEIVVTFTPLKTNKYILILLLILVSPTVTHYIYKSKNGIFVFLLSIFSNGTFYGILYPFVSESETTIKKILILTLGMVLICIPAVCTLIVMTLKEKYDQEKLQARFDLYKTIAIFLSFIATIFNFSVTFLDSKKNYTLFAQIATLAFYPNTLIFYMGDILFKFKKYLKLKNEVHKEVTSVHKEIASTSELRYKHMETLSNSMKTQQQAIETVITESRAERHKKKSLWKRVFGD